MSEEGTYAASDFNSSDFYWKNGLKYYNDDQYTSRIGIDVSEHQGTIDWKKVKNAGIQFAMIRIGFSGEKDGTITEDSCFEQNLKNAKAAGLDVGVYFYSNAVSTDEAVAEAKFIIEKIRRRGVRYPVCFDMEVEQNSRDSALTSKQRTEISTAFCQVISQNGHKPILYGNPTYFSSNVDLSYLTEYDLWLAHYVNISSFPYKFMMWQYSSTGKLPGISTSCDMDIAFISK